MFSNTVSRGKIEVIWKLRDRPEPVDLVRRQAVDRAAVQRDRARGDGKPPADQVEQRRLAGAVRADHGVALAARDVEVDAADDLGAAEALVHVAAARCAGGLTASPPSPWRRRSGRPSARESRAPRGAATAPPPIRADRAPASRAWRVAGVDGVAEPISKALALRRADGEEGHQFDQHDEAEHARAARAPGCGDRARRARAAGRCGRSARAAATMPVRPPGANITMTMNSTPT